MTQRSAKVVTAYRGSVKKQIKLISGYEVFRGNNGLLTIIQVASPQWTGWLAQDLPGSRRGRQVNALKCRVQLSPKPYIVSC